MVTLFLTYLTAFFLQTTAHTLVFAFALLALYPDEQERLYQEVVKYLPGNELPVSLVGEVCAEC